MKQRPSMGAVQDAFLQLITTLGDFMMGPWTLAFIALVSVYLTFRTRFFQVVHFIYIFRSTFGRIFDRPFRIAEHPRCPMRSSMNQLDG